MDDSVVRVLAALAWQLAETTMERDAARSQLAQVNARLAESDKALAAEREHLGDRGLDVPAG